MADGAEPRAKYPVHLADGVLAPDSLPARPRSGLGTEGVATPDVLWAECHINTEQIGACRVPLRRVAIWRCTEVTGDCYVEFGFGDHDDSGRRHLIRHISARCEGTAAFEKAEKFALAIIRKGAWRPEHYTMPKTPTESVPGNYLAYIATGPVLLPSACAAKRQGGTETMQDDNQYVAHLSKDTLIRLSRLINGLLVQRLAEGPSPPLPPLEKSPGLLWSQVLLHPFQIRMYAGRQLKRIVVYKGALVTDDHHIRFEFVDNDGVLPTSHTISMHREGPEEFAMAEKIVTVLCKDTNATPAWVTTPLHLRRVGLPEQNEEALSHYLVYDPLGPAFFPMR